MSIQSGYTGLYHQPYANNSTYGDTLYVITDDAHQELDLLLLTPGSYQEAYRLCTRVTFHIINIFVPSADVLFISDVFRLVTDLLKIGKAVHFYHPDKLTTTPTNVLFEMAQMQNKCYISPIMSDLTIEFRPSTTSTTHKYYDLYVCDGENYAVFCMSMNAEKLTSLMTSKEYDAVHLPYNMTFYGGLTGRECANLNARWESKLVPNNFNCREEYIEAIHSHMGRPKRFVM